MLFTTFLLLGCLAFALIIGHLVPASVWAGIGAFVLAYMVTPDWWDAEKRVGIAASLTAVYCLAIWHFGTHEERQTARKERQRAEREIALLRATELSAGLPPTPLSNEPPPSAVPQWVQVIGAAVFACVAAWYSVSLGDL